MHSAANGGWDQILELILDEDAEIDPEDKTGVGNDILNAGGNVFHQSQERNKKKNSRITWDSIPTSLSDVLVPLSHIHPLVYIDCLQLPRWGIQSLSDKHLTANHKVAGLHMCWTLPNFLISYYIRCIHVYIRLLVTNQVPNNIVLYILKCWFSNIRYL